MSEAEHDELAAWTRSLPPAPPIRMPQRAFLRWAAGRAWSPHYPARADLGGRQPDRALLKRVAVNASGGSLPDGVGRLPDSAAEDINLEEQEAAVAFLAAASERLPRKTTSPEDAAGSPEAKSDAGSAVRWTPGEKPPDSRMMSMLLQDLTGGVTRKAVEAAGCGALLQHAPEAIEGDRKARVTAFREADQVTQRRWRGLVDRAFAMISNAWPASWEEAEAALAPGAALEAHAGVDLLLALRTAYDCDAPAARCRRRMAEIRRTARGEDVAADAPDEPRRACREEEIGRFETVSDERAAGEPGNDVGRRAVAAFAGLIERIELDAPPEDPAKRSRPEGNLNPAAAIDAQALSARIRFLNREIGLPIAEALQDVAFDLHFCLFHRAGLEVVQPADIERLRPIALATPWPASLVQPPDEAVRVAHAEFHAASIDEAEATEETETDAEAEPA